MYLKFTRWAVGGAVVLSLAVTANLTQAASLTSVQINSIVNLLQSFGADQNTINNVQAALNGQATTGSQPSGQTGAGNRCYGFSHNLLVGSTDKSSGGEVSQLQAILGVSQTGYFGAKTKQAVMNWQKEHDINPAGVVGPATRAALACGDTSATVSTTGTLSAAPTAGAAPLSVNFKFMTSGTVDYSGINFGDNTSITDMAGSGYCSPNACAVTHVYTKTGTYTAKLHDSKGAVISSKTITVGDGSGSPSATIDQSSLNANTGVLSGTATGLTQVYIDLLTYTPAKSACWTELHAPIAVSVVNNTWTYNLGVDAGVAAGTQVVILDSNAAGVVPHTLASGIYKSASAPAQNCTPGA